MTGSDNQLMQDDSSAEIIGAAMDVHSELGPGLLESAYEECICHELNIRDISFRRQLAIPVEYKGLKLDCGFRVDLLVQDRLVVELKSVERLQPVHQAQLLTYMKLLKAKSGLLLNFNVRSMKNGIKRMVL